MDISFYQENNLWKFTDSSGVSQGIPLGMAKWSTIRDKLSIRIINEPEWLFYNVEVTSILKSATPDDYYASISEFLSINESFFVNASSDGGLISGTATNFASLPTASEHLDEVWFVSTASGGYLTWLGVYKYPKGLYSPNPSGTWEILPVNVKVAGDAMTLLNISNWTEYIAFSFDVKVGDIVNYNNILYKNKTGTRTSTAPDTDTTNWANVITKFPIFEFGASVFDVPLSSDWPVNAVPLLAVDSVQGSTVCRQFDDTTSQGVDFVKDGILIPINAVSMRIVIEWRAQTAAGAVRTVGLGLYNKNLTAGTAWSSVATLSDLSVPDSIARQRTTIDIDLTSYVKNNNYKFELVRKAPQAGTNLPGYMNLFKARITFL